MKLRIHLPLYYFLPERIQHKFSKKLNKEDSGVLDKSTTTIVKQVNALKVKAIKLAYKTDSLQQVIAINEQYYSSIKKVLTGDVATVYFNKDSIIEAAEIDESALDLIPSKEDSLLREKVLLEDKYNPLISNSKIMVSVFLKK